jgi:hypothetical protein
VVVRVPFKSGNYFSVILCNGGEIWQNFVSLCKIVDYGSDDNSYTYAQAGGGQQLLHGGGGSADGY